MKYIALYLILINAAGYLLMLADKHRARKNLWRISENTLLTVALLGGSVGATAGMYQFRHKTKHLKFVVGLPVILALQVLGSIWLYGHFFS